MMSQLFPRYTGPALLPQVCTVDNLTLAWRRVRRNIQVARHGQSAGVDAITIRDFEADWPRQMGALAEELLGGSYRPLPARTAHIPKRSGGSRAIAILAVRDRIAQRAVHQVLEPLFDPLLLDCSYGCRPHVGVPHALNRVERYAAQGLTWVAESDIARYFDSIDQRVLLALLRQRLDEPALLALIGRWLAAGSVAHEPALTAVETPIQRAVEAARGWFETPAPQLPPSPAVWGDAGDGWGAPGWDGLARGPQLGNQLWTVVMLAHPALDQAKRLLPHVQRVGPAKLALAATMAIGTIAAVELAARRAPRGTPQGSALSPLLANIYLHPFDVALSAEGFRLVRFVDDFVVMCADEAEAGEALAAARRQLHALRLVVNEEKTRVVAYAGGLEFLGRALVPPGRGVRIEDGLRSFEEAQQRLRAARKRPRTEG